MDSFYITDKGLNYIDTINTYSMSDLKGNDNLLEDAVVLGTIRDVDGEVFKVLEEKDFKPAIRRLFEAGYIEKE